MDGPLRTRTLACTIVLLAACVGKSTKSATTTGDSLTERQRDSILARSRIPGASGVGRALNAADSTSARIRATDSVTP